MSHHQDASLNIEPDLGMEALTCSTTPTIANALECLGLDPAAGFSDASLRLLTDGLPAFVGRAVTAKIVTAKQLSSDESPRVATETYWSYVAAHPGPTVVVAEDLDPDPVGAMWGEVQGRLHRSLGVVGIVTNGAVRDIDELKRVPLPVVASRTCVSHAYARFVEIDVPVVVGGLQVRPGDLLHADRHGVQLVPADVSLPELADTARQIELLEGELFAAADHNSGDLEEFLETWRSVQSRWPHVASHR